MCSGEESQACRRVGSFTLAGMTSLEELEMLEEEEEEEEVTEGRMKQTGPVGWHSIALHLLHITGVQVRIRRADDTVFEGQYEEGLPHGFFRHLNQVG